MKWAGLIDFSQRQQLTWALQEDVWHKTKGANINLSLLLLNVVQRLFVGGKHLPLRHLVLSWDGSTDQWYVSCIRLLIVAP